jgi:uncharacterized protein YozE (UPF0346 family)
LPLSDKARIEVYIPDLPRPAYQELLNALDREFTYTFGGCTILRNLGGSYLSKLGFKIQDRINLIYTDTSFPFEKNFEKISRYTDELKQAIYEALEEEAVFIVVLKVYHAE